MKPHHEKVIGGSPTSEIQLRYVASDPPAHLARKYKEDISMLEMNQLITPTP